MDWQDKIAITDYGVMAVLFAIGIVACVKSYREPGLSDDAKRLIVGIGLICAWGMLHQSFWFARWWLFSIGDSRTQWFLDNSWLLMGPYLLAFVGSVKVAYALFRARCFVTRVREVPMQWLSGWKIWAAMIALLWIITYGVLP